MYHQELAPNDFIPKDQPFYHNFDTFAHSESSPPSDTRSLAPSFCSTQHRYTLRVAKDNARPWLSLLLSSRSPKSELPPLYIGKDIISGTVEFDLVKPETIREITVTLKGECTYISNDPTIFLDMSRTLAKPSGKLSGQHSYPFTYTLPDDVTVNHSNWAMVYPLPPKFHERGIVYIDYKIVVTVLRGRFSVDHSLVSNFCYIPETTAERPSTLREQVYSTPSPSGLPTPALDPGGWKSLPSVQTVLVPNTSATLRLWIASPLSFALGTPIPLYLEVRTDGANSFDPESIDVCLVRTLPTHGLAGDGRRLDVARAEWWLASEQGSSLHRTQFWGEILVNKALTPSFDFSMCSVRYSIVLYSRSSPQNSEREPLLSEDVILALRNPVGVVPLPQAPPRTSTRPLERRPSAVARSFVAQGRHRAGRIT